MSTYQAFRDNEGPTLYDSNKTSVTVDVLEIGLVFAICILTFSFIIILPGFRGKSLITISVKVFLGIFITGLIMLCNFGQEWEVADIHTVTQYRAGLREEIEADIEVKIGLRSVNITLKATPDEDVTLADGKVKETVNYNERFSWNNPGWVQGRGGFGPFAGLINREFREGQLKGLPYPILWIAEYFTIDGEGIRWGRHYRQAGFYAHTMMWLAFPVWVLAMILMHVVVRYGGYMSILTSVILFTANIIYASIRNPEELKVPFEDDVLEFSWGWCFWLNVFNGFLCFFIGLAIIVADILFYEKLVGFFGLDILSDYEEIYGDPTEISALAGVIKPASRSMKRAATLRAASRKVPRGGNISRNAMPAPPSPPSAADAEAPAPPPIPQKRQFRKRQIGLTQRSKLRSTRNTDSLSAVTIRDIRPPPVGGDQDEQVYEMDRLPEQPDNNRFLYRSGSGEMDNAVNANDIPVKLMT